MAHKLHSRARSIENFIEEQGLFWPQFLGAPRMDFVLTPTSCRLYPKVAIETKHPDHFATKAECLS